MEIKRITCNNAIEAEGLHAALQEVGIESKTYDETNSKVARGILDGTVDVLVAADDLPRASQIYESLLASRQQELPWCPKCGSENVSAQKKKHAHARQLPRILATLLMLIPFGTATSQTFVCQDCGHRWER